MPEGATVVVRYWAGARAAAGAEQDQVVAATVDEALSAVVARRPDLARVLPACTVLVDGRAVERDAPLGAATLLEVLPPFAGG